MTNVSMFFRGSNFELKHTNTFNLSDVDMQDYMKLKRQDQE